MTEELTYAWKKKEKFPFKKLIQSHSFVYKDDNRESFFFFSNKLFPKTYSQRRVACCVNHPVHTQSYLLSSLTFFVLIETFELNNNKPRLPSLKGIQCWQIEVQRFIPRERERERERDRNVESVNRSEMSVKNRGCM